MSGLLRVSILVLISKSSASTLQLVNAAAVPLVATILTSGQQQNLHALLLALGGSALYVLGHKQKVTKAIATSTSIKVRQRALFMEEVKLQQKEKKQQQRLRRLTEGWDSPGGTLFMEEVKLQQKEKK